jgi:hypothetical protein
MNSLYNIKYINFIIDKQIYNLLIDKILNHRKEGIITNTNQNINFQYYAFIKT